MIPALVEAGRNIKSAMAHDQEREAPFSLEAVFLTLHGNDSVDCLKNFNIMKIFLTSRL